MDRRACSSTRVAIRAVLAQRVLALAALAMLVAAAAGGAEAGFGTPGVAAVRIHADLGSLGWLTLGTLAVAVGMATADAGSAARTKRPVPRLGMAAALALLVTTYVLGALAMLATATGHATAATSLGAARWAVVDGSFVVLLATATVEWAAASDGTTSDAAVLSTAGVVQVGALVLAAVAQITGVLTSNLALTEANLPLQLTGIAIFLVRVAPALLTSGWARGSRIWLVTSVVALAVDVGLVVHVVFEVGVQRYAYAGQVPAWLVFTVDHVAFAGAGTAALIGGINAVAGQQERWPRADAVAAAALALGLAGTAASIAVGSPVGEGVAGTVFGISLLVSAAVTAVRVTLPHVPAGRIGEGNTMSVP
jgi:hypothetical protein